MGSRDQIYVCCGLLSHIWAEYCHEKWCNKMVSSQGMNHEESVIGRA